MPGSPLPTARVHRRTSSPHQTPTQLSVAPSNASFTPQPQPQQQVIVGTACGSKRASPLRTQGHVQSAPCIGGTPPPTARICGSHIHLGQVVREDLVARAAQKLQVQSNMPTARGNPIRVGAVPSHVARSPRVAG
jgi:hypothetical protein